MKYEAGNKEQREIADCRFQIADSRIESIERQTGNLAVTQKRWLWLLLFILGSILLTICAFYFDAAVQGWIGQHRNRTAQMVMHSISRFGDWPEHLLLGLLLIGAAWLRGSRKWTRIFLSMLIALAIAGLAGSLIKISTGRARPSVKSEEVWSGPRFRSKFHAFPSGHTASSTAFFAVLFFANWRFGLACSPIPILIGFSRMYIGAHHLSDVVFAVLLGILCAFVSICLLPPDRQSKIEN